MRWLIRLAFPALGLLVLLIFFGIHDPDATPSKPETTQTDASTKSMPSFEGLVPTPISKDEGPEIVFKWRDTDGSWHYADQPPERGAWNALAIEPPRPNSENATKPGKSKDDWQAPYSAPFALDAAPFHALPEHARNDT